MTGNGPSLTLIDWTALDAESRRAALERPAQRKSREVAAAVAGIIADVRSGGDAALRSLTLRHDRVELARFEVQAGEFAAAAQSLASAAVVALERAIENVRRFHEAQRPAPVRVEVMPGVLCEQLARPLDAVGLYVPAGTAPLPSTAIMLAVPAALAGCRSRVLATPPRADGTADPAVLVAARLCGVDRVFKLGGAQAIAALAYGTESVPKVDKIYGPGNAWVTAAKLAVAADPAGAALDLPAGPSEVLVIADADANPEFVAADLLAQAEHSVDAQAVLVTPDRRQAKRVSDAVARQVQRLSRTALLLEALTHARIIVVADLETAFEVSNAYAPEHLILHVDGARDWLPRVTAAGSVFVGAWAPETMGDYCSGTNHVLPTYGFARTHSGLTLQDFMHTITVQELTAQGLKDLGPTAVTIAALEGLDGHARAVTIRLEALAGPAH
jgi:histidinol dehydrogenase